MDSLSRDEVARTFGLRPHVLDALIATGHLLCHVRDGETRIPLEQLEAFFRDGLLNVYRAQANAETIVTSFDNAIALPPPPVAPVEPEPPPPQAMEAPAPSVAPASVLVREREVEVPESDLRISPRFIPRRQINGIIDDVKFTIVQLSRTGLRIRHTEDILHSPDSKLTFALLNPARSFMMKGKVVWTSVATTDSGERKFFVSGVRITEHVDRLVTAIAILSAAHDLQPDRRQTDERRGSSPDDESLPMAGASDEEIDLVMKAINHFAADPLDANRWYARGRFALADAQVRRDAPRKPREREEVLGMWEYLNRQLEMGKINDILGWVRRHKTVAVER